MSDVDDSTPPGDDQPANPRKRFTMKSLNDLVDDAPSSPAEARPDAEPEHHAPSASAQRAAVGPSARRRLLDEVSGTGARRGPRPEPRAEPSGPRRAGARVVPPEPIAEEPVDAPPAVLEEPEAPVAPAEAEVAPVVEAEAVVEAEPTVEADQPASPLDEAPPTRSTKRTRPGAAVVEDDGPGGGTASLPSPIGAPSPDTSSATSGAGGSVDVAEAAAEAEAEPEPDDTTAWPLARQMLDQEVAEGGRVSNPHDVAGLVLALAKDLPAAAAVSVVRMDEEIELVGNTIDPDVDPASFAMIFSGLMRVLNEAHPLLANGPLGAVADVVIEAENMDLILRPLGPHFYLLVIEDRRSAHANLAGTRLQMAAVAPGLAATLAHDDGID